MPACSKDKRERRKLTFLKVYKATCNKAKALLAINANRSTVWRWSQDDPGFREEIIEVEQSWLDRAEEGLINHIKEGNLSAIKFLLKSKGKSRGYAPSLSIEKKVKEERIDTKRIELLMGNNETRQALEILAQSVLEAGKKDEENIWEAKEIYVGGYRE